MSIFNLFEYMSIKEDEKKEKALLKKKEKHKCNKCPYGSWAGNKFVCMFQHCVKEDGFK